MVNELYDIIQSSVNMATKNIKNQPCSSSCTAFQGDDIMDQLISTLISMYYCLHLITVLLCGQIPRSYKVRFRRSKTVSRNNFWIPGKIESR